MLYNQQGWQQGGYRSGPATSTALKKKNVIGPVSRWVSILKPLARPNEVTRGWGGVWSWSWFRSKLGITGEREHEV